MPICAAGGLINTASGYIRVGPTSTFGRRKRGGKMMEKWQAMLAGMLDDHNLVIYLLFTLAMVYPDLAEGVTGGLLGFLVRDKVVQK